MKQWQSRGRHQRAEDRASWMKNPLKSKLAYAHGSGIRVENVVTAMNYNHPVAPWQGKNG